MDDKTFRAEVNKTLSDITNYRIHPVDGCLRLRDLRDHKYKLFSTLFMAHPEWEDVVNMCAHFVIDNIDSTYRELAHETEKIPLEERLANPPEYFKGKPIPKLSKEDMFLTPKVL